MFIAIQADPELIHQFERLVTTQMVVAVVLSLISLAILGVAIGSLFAIRKLISTMDHSMNRLTPRLDPLLTSVTRIADDAEDMASSVKHRLNNLMKSVDELNDRVMAGADAVEDRVRKFGMVVEVVQAEAEEILLDAASAARGVHTASQILRAGTVEDPDLLDDEDEYEDLADEDHDDAEADDEDEYRG